MRKIVLILLVSLLWLYSGVPVALADGMILPEMFGLGYLGVRYHHVTVSIEDNHAVTRVEQEFYNPYDFAVYGQYLFPVPPDAIFSDFKATMNGVAQTVTRQDAATTNGLLYANVVQQRDPSLLQYVDWESLAFPITLQPGESCHVVLEYEEVLPPVGGMVRYRYTLSTERYTSQPLEEVSVTVDVRSSSGLADVYSSSHPVTVERVDKNQARASWEAQNVTPTDDFELFVTPAGSGFGGGLLTGQRNGHDHFLFIFAPEADPIRDDSLPKDIVFVMDHSGSMSGGKIEQARNALQFALGQLGGDDRFSIVGFDDRVAILASTLQPVTGETLADARQYVDRMRADGSTDLDAALQAGLEILSNSERRDAPQIVVFLTDGLPTTGITDEARIAERAAQTNSRLESRLHVFGVGYDVNTHLLDRLAADNGGTVTYVQPGENLEEVLTGFYGQIAHPALTDVEVAFEGMAVGELYPKAIPDMFAGSSLLLTGRYEATSDTVAVRVRGQAGDRVREYVYQFDLRQASGHDFVPRLWATRRIGDLLDRVRVEGESPALVEEIEGLGLAYGLVTPYTTFTIQAQVDGAASMDNMALYGRTYELNQVSGQVTVQARAQNLAYQNAAQADVAIGANVLNNGQHSLAQTYDLTQNDPTQAPLNVDLSLLQGQGNLDGPVNVQWIEDNVGIDRTVVFGSQEYFALASDPANRPFLQSGTNVVFSQGGEVILVQEGEVTEYRPVTGQANEAQTSERPMENPDPESAAPYRAPSRQESGATSVEARSWIPVLLLLVVVGALAGGSITLNVWQVLYHRKSTRR